MTDFQIVKTDQGAVNARILAKEAKADFRRVEAASLKLRTHFTSAEAKRLFVRMFSTLQLNAHFVSVIARTRIDHQEIEKAETELRTDIDAVKNKLNQALDGAEALFKAHGITSFATYDTQPLDIEVGVLSSNGRRYLEVLNQFDQLMPLLQTLEIHEVITTQALDIQRAVLKRQIKDIATLARRQATELRRRMNAMAARDGERATGAEPPMLEVAASVGLEDEGNGDQDITPRLPAPLAEEATTEGAAAVAVRRARRRLSAPEASAEEDGADSPSEASPRSEAGDDVGVAKPAPGVEAATNVGG